MGKTIKVLAEVVVHLQLEEIHFFQDRIVGATSIEPKLQQPITNFNSSLLEPTRVFDIGTATSTRRTSRKFTRKASDGSKRKLFFCVPLSTILPLWVLIIQVANGLIDRNRHGSGSSSWWCGSSGGGVVVVGGVVVTVSVLKRFRVESFPC